MHQLQTVLGRDGDRLDARAADRGEHRPVSGREIEHRALEHEHAAQQQPVDRQNAAEESGQVSHGAPL